MLSSTVCRITLAAFSPYFSFHSASHWSSLFGSFFCLGQQLSIKYLYTYVRSRLQVCRIDSVLVEAWPLLKCLLGTRLILLVVPIHHVWRILEVYTPTEDLQNAFRIIKEIICIHHADVGTFLACSIRRIAIYIAVGVVAMVRPNMSDFPEVLEDSANFVVAGFSWVKVVEASQFVKWWYRASVIGGDAGMRIANQEGEMEHGQHVGWNDCRVLVLRVGVERVWGTNRSSVDIVGPIDAIDMRLILGSCPDATFDTQQRWRNAGWLTLGRHEVVDDVLDEQALALFMGK